MGAAGVLIYSQDQYLQQVVQVVVEEMDAHAPHRSFRLSRMSKDCTFNFITISTTSTSRGFIFKSGTDARIVFGTLHRRRSSRPRAAFLCQTHLRPLRHRLGRSSLSSLAHRSRS